MKSLKLTRMMLALALALCMVLSVVSVSASEVAVSANLGSRLGDGWYSATVNVTGVSEGYTSVVVYPKGAAVNENTIVYLNQSAGNSGSFAMEVPHGEFTVVGGGSDADSSTTTLVANTAPAFAQASYNANIYDNAAAGTVVASIAATDVDGDAISYTLSGSAKFALNGSNNIVVADGATFNADDAYNLTLTANDGYAEASATVAVSVADSTVYYNVESVSAVADIYVRSGDTAGDIVLPAKVTLTYDTNKTVDADVNWGAITLPTVGNDTVVTGTITIPSIGTGYVLTNTNGLTASATLKRVDDSLALTVNGAAANDTYYVAVNGSAEIAVTYGNAGAGVEYAYVVSDSAATPAVPAQGWTSSATYNYVAGKTAGVVYITAFVNDNGNYYNKQAEIEVTDAVYTANIYVNATEDTPTFAAYRVNANGGLKLTSRITNMNNDPISGTVEYAICNVPEGGVKGDVLLANATGIFTAVQLKTLALNKQYWVRVSLIDDEEIVAYAGRLIYLANYGASYTSYIIDGRTNRSGLGISKNKDLNFSVTFDEGNADDGELYASYMIVPYDKSYDDNTYAVAQGDYTKTSGLVYAATISDLGDTPSGAYNLVWKAKKTEDQTFVDRTIAKSIYLYGRIAMINNIYLNGSTNCALGNPASLTLKAHWMDAYLEADAPDLTYKYEIYKWADELTEANRVYTSDIVADNATVTIDDLSALDLAFKNVVRLSVYRAGVLDYTYDKIFYPTISAE